MSDVVLVVGDGVYGTSMAKRLADHGIRVVLTCHDLGRFSRWSKGDFSEASEWVPAMLGAGVELAQWDREPRRDYSAALLCTSMQGLVGSCQLAAVRGVPCVAVMQKGLLEVEGQIRTPFEVAELVLPPYTTVFSFTGPAFASSVAGTAEFQMVVGASYKKRHEAVAFTRLFKNVKGIWPLYTADPRGLGLAYALRTVGSVYYGVIAGYLAREGAPDRTTAHNLAGVLVSEISHLLFGLGAAQEVADLNSPVAQTWVTDFNLCTSPDSRNYALGKLVGQGIPLGDALLQSKSTVEGALNTLFVGEMLQGIGPDAGGYPFFKSILGLMRKECTAEEVARQLLSRREERFNRCAF